MNTISIVVAMNQDNIIGVNNCLPWHIPEDLKHFKSLTLGKVVIMGRKTFESIGKALPGRVNVVISRNKNFTASDVVVVDSLEMAISRYNDVPELCIIGGGEIFSLAMVYVNVLHLTIIDYKIDLAGAVYFPRIDLSGWSKLEEKTFTTASGISGKFVSYKKD